jgi:putative transposase
MKFISGNIYHVYNQGNNHQTLFFTNDDYITFLKQTRDFILPNADFIAYCLMPNHFHFLIHADDRCNMQHKQGGIIIDPVTNGFRKLLSGYARIFNKRYNQSGSLFRQKTKSKCLSDTINSSRNILETNACFNCFHYIHQNPLRANLVSRLEDWEFSSYKDYAGLRKGTLCNKIIAKDYCWYDSDNFEQQSYKIITEDKI